MTHMGTFSFPGKGVAKGQCSSAVATNMEKVDCTIEVFSRNALVKRVQSERCTCVVSAQESHEHRDLFKKND